MEEIFINTPFFSQCMDVAVMFSGGKDSTYTVEYCKNKGWNIKYLLSIKPDRTDCYLFHFATVEHTPLLAKSLELQHHLLHCTVADPDQEAKIVFDFVKEHPIDALVLGGVGLQETQLRTLQKWMQLLHVEVFASHAGYEHDLLMQEMIEKGYDIRITQIAADGLTKEWLGKKLMPESFAELKKLSAKYGFHIGAEGGHYDTFVCDGPLFKHKIEFVSTEKVMETNCSGYLVVKKLNVVEKEVEIIN